MSATKRPLEAEAGLIAQVAGVAVAAEAQHRAAAAGVALAKQDGAFAEALDEVHKVRQFIGAPERILGNPDTKHGEIAESIEVGIRRARQLLEGAQPSAWKHPDRLGAADYIIDGDNVQSKFINGVNNTLDHVREHMHRYPAFGRNGSYYHIPRDQHEIIEKALRGDSHPGFSERTLSRIAEKAREVHQVSGKRDFNEVVRPGISDYADVQQGRVHSTLDAHERDFAHRNDDLEHDIQDHHSPSLEGAGHAAVRGFVVGAGIRLVVNVYDNYKRGKRIWRGDYSSADWQQLGLEMVQGGAVGGISAAALYGLTNYADLAAPFAGGVVSSALSVASLASRFRKGELSLDEFCELGQLACLEGAAVGLATALGQALIPVPVLGGLLGAAAGRLLVSASKDVLSGHERALRDKLRGQYDDTLRNLDLASQAAMATLMARYDALGDLLIAAFDFEANAHLRFGASVNLARELAVPNEHILGSVGAIDEFILN